MIRFKRFLAEQKEENIWIDPKNEVHKFPPSLTHGDWIASNFFHQKFEWSMFRRAFEAGWVRVKNSREETDVHGKKDALRRTKDLWLKIIKDYFKFADNGTVNIEVNAGEVGLLDMPDYTFSIPRDMGKIRSLAL